MTELVCQKTALSWGPNWVFGKIEEYGFLSVKKVKTKFWAKVKEKRLKISLNFPHVKTEE